MKDLGNRFCILPWTHLRVEASGVVYPCCISEGDFNYGSLKSSSLAEIWNGEPVRRMRRQLLAGAAPEQCRTCHRLTDAGLPDIRAKMNRDFPAEFARLERTAPDGSLPDGDRPTYLDMRFSNVCNFRCRSCSALNSTGWYAESRAFGASVGDGPLRPTASAEDLWRELDAVVPQLKRIYFAGGEPLLEADHYLFLERLIAAGRTDIDLNYNSNFSHLGYRHWDAPALWANFRSVSIGASFDGVGAPGELLRKGQDWERAVRNFRDLRARAPHVGFMVCPTVSVMNAFHLTEAFDAWIELGMVRGEGSLWLNSLTGPPHLSLDILNAGERSRLSAHYAAYLSARETLAPELHATLARACRYVLDSIGPESGEEMRRAFRRFTFELDRSRKERFVTLFPESMELLYG